MVIKQYKVEYVDWKERDNSFYLFAESSLDAFQIASKMQGVLFVKVCKECEYTVMKDGVETI